MTIYCEKELCQPLKISSLNVNIITRGPIIDTKTLYKLEIINILKETQGRI